MSLTGCALFKKGTDSAKEQAATALTDISFSFYSKGKGTDKTARKAFEEYLTSFEGSNMVKLAYDKISWGREGEYDLCFKLTELSPDMATEFVSGARQTLDGKQVRIKENTGCKK
jgi:hypothetical protein